MDNLSEREAGIVERFLTDPQRMLWRDDVEGICATPGMCFEYSETARCGPCAIRQADARGVETNHSVPNLPEVYRLRRHIEAQADELANMREALNCFVRGQYPVSPEINPRGHNWCEPYLDEALLIARAALGAKP